MIKYAIIIPAYHAHNTIHTALNSIVAQTLVKCARVYVVDDCDEVGYDYLTADYPGLDIVVARTQKNGGPTAARNLGLEMVIADQVPYILFMDADDCFYSPLTIYYFDRELQSRNWDLITGNFLQQVIKNKKAKYLIHQDKNIWLFAKLYKTRIIADNNIRFFQPSENEDVGFNLQYSVYMESAIAIQEILYLWRWNDNSITRSEQSAYDNHCVIGLYQNCFAVYQKLANDTHIPRDRYRLKVAERMILMYVDWNMRYTQWSQSVAREVFQLMRLFYFKFYKPWERTYTKRQLSVCGSGIFTEDLDSRAKIPFIPFLRELGSQNYSSLFQLAIKKEGA